MTQQKARIARQKPRKTSQELQAERQARKHALGVLHRLYYEHYVPLAPFDSTLFDEIYDAFRVLALFIHGEPTGTQWTTLCDCCHESYHDHWVEMQKEGSYFPLTQNCCAPCKDRLLGEGRLLKIDGNPVISIEREH